MMHGPMNVKPNKIQISRSLRRKLKTTYQSAEVILSILNKKYLPPPPKKLRKLGY